MPLYQIEAGGKTYEVEAADQATALAALQKGPGLPGAEWTDVVGRSRAELAGLVSPVAGVAQKATGLGEGVGLLPEGSTEAVTGAARGVQEWIQGVPNEALTEAQRAGKGVAGFAAEAAIPIGGAAKGAKLLGEGVQAVRGGLPSIIKAGKTVAKGAGVGAGGAALHFDPEVESAWESNLGLAAGAGLGSVTAPLLFLPSAIKNKVTAVLRAPPTPESRKLLDELRKSDIWKSAEKRLTLGQRTGDPRIEIQEARVQGRIAQNVYNRQLEDAEKRLMQIVDGPPSKTPATMGEDLRQSLEKARWARQRAASNEYGTALDEAEAIARQDPANRMGVKTENFQTALVDSAVSREQWQTLANAAPQKYRRAIEEAFDMLQKNEGRMQLGDMMKVHQALNQMRKGLSRLTKMTKEEADLNRLGADLQSALQRDMDHMDSVVRQAEDLSKQTGVTFDPSMPGQKYREAWTKFRGAREQYATRMNEEKYIEAQILEKEFGFSPNDPEAAFRTIFKAPPAEQNRMIVELEKNFPDTMRDLKAWKLQDALKQAFQQQASGAKAALKADALIKQLTNGQDVVAAKMWTPGELQDIKSGVAYLRLIQSRSQLKDPGVEPMRVIMALASRSVAFLSSSAYRMLGNPGLERLLFSAKGRESLQALATAPKGSTAYTAAMGYLGSLTGDTLAE
jgi:hypothetical protein